MKDMKKNMKNEKAVSAVIGVILMVVVTVIIAAILAVFVFGIGAPAKAPEAKLKFVAVTNYTNVSRIDFKVTHAGGDPIILKEEQLIVKDAVTDVVGNIAVNGTSTDGSPMTLYFNGTTLSPGFSLVSEITGLPKGKGDILIIQVMDVPTGQMVADVKITVQ